TECSTQRHSAHTAFPPDASDQHHAVRRCRTEVGSRGAGQQGQPGSARRTGPDRRRVHRVDRRRTAMTDATALSVAVIKQVAKLLDKLSEEQLTALVDGRADLTFVAPEGTVRATSRRPAGTSR